MQKIVLTATLSLALLFLATLNLHAASHGTYIDCVHGCSDQTVCDQTFRDILTVCNANLDNCLSLCTRTDRDCRNACRSATNDCFKQDTRFFECQLNQPGTRSTRDNSCSWPCHGGPTS